MEPGRRASLWLLVGLGAYGVGKKGFIMAPGRPRCLWSREEGLHYGSW